MKTFFVSPVGNDKNVGTEREQAFYTQLEDPRAVSLAAAYKLFPFRIDLYADPQKNVVKSLGCVCFEEISFF